MANSPADALRVALEALGQADMGALDSALSRQHPVLWIGTDPAEWWDDRGRILELFEIQLKELGGPSVSIGDIVSGESGDGGWAACRAQISIPNGPSLEFRVTAACAREDGDWRVVQCHASIGAGNEDAVGTELTV